MQGGIVGVGVYSGGVLVTNYVLANPVETIIAVDDFINSYLPGIPTASKAGYIGGCSRKSVWI